MSNCPNCRSADYWPQDLELLSDDELKLECRCKKCGNYFNLYADVRHWRNER